MDPHQEFLQYWAAPAATRPEILDLPPARELKKVAILLKFQRAFNSAARSVRATRFARDVPLAHVNTWMRGSEGILFCMSDQTVQLNFADKQKLLVLRRENQVMLLQNLTEKAPLVPLSAVRERSPIGQRFGIAKGMLRELNGPCHGPRETM
jgi:hypothetical protein